MSEPQRYGLLKECRVGVEFANSLHTIVKVLHATFSQSPLDKLFPPCVNEFMKSKA